MATSTIFYVKGGDAGIVVTGTVLDANGDPVDLTGAILAFQARRPFTSDPIIDSAATADPDQTANTGQWSYTLTADDLAAGGGSYWVTLQATWGAHVETFPSKGYNTLEIEEEVD